MNDINKVLDELYKGCKNYAPDMTLQDAYDKDCIWKCLMDMCKFIYSRTNLQICREKFKSLKIKDVFNGIENIMIMPYKYTVPFNVIFQCAVINIIEQLVYIRKICRNNKDNIAKKAYINSLFGPTNDNIYEKDNIYIKFETLLKQTRNKIYKGINHKFSSFFEFYEQFVFDETDKGYHTAISKIYPNLVYSLFNLDSLYNSTYIQTYNLIPNTSGEEISEDIYNLYFNICTNIKNATPSANLAEFIIIERLYGLKTFGEIVKREIKNSEKENLVQIIYYIRNFGFTPLHQYIIDNYTEDLKEKFIDATLKASEIVEKTMQTFTYYVIDLLRKYDTLKMEKILDRFISSLYNYLVEVEGNVSYSFDKIENFELYYDLMDNVEDNDFILDELPLYDLEADKLKKYVTIVSKRRRFGMSYHFYLKSTKKYKYESVEEYSQKQYINTLYGISYKENESNMDLPFFHKRYRIKY